MIHAISESPKQAGVIWVGTNDGLVQVTRDGGKSWTNVTKNMPNLPPWGTVGNIEASRYDAGTAYVTVDFHQVNNRDPFVYRTGDYGASWKLITNGIPHSMLSYAHCIREDTVKRGLLFLGTENAVYVSFDDGENWQPLQNNLPHAPVYWLVVQEHFNDLVIATYGRGAWILDDITPLREMTSQVLNADAHLFPVRQVYRFRSITAPATPYDDLTVGENPPYGADINYFLKSAPTGNVAITIQDSKGQTVRTLQGPKNAGLNRIYWDLRDTPSKRVTYRTTPLFAPEIRVGPDGIRESEGGFGGGGGGLAIMQPPGTYTVKLSVGGRDYTQQLRVLKDPHSAGTEADIAAQQQMLTALRRDLDEAVDAVNSAELVRAQIVNRRISRRTPSCGARPTNWIEAGRGRRHARRAALDGRGQTACALDRSSSRSLATSRTASPTAISSRRTSRSRCTDLQDRFAFAGSLTEVFNRELAAFNDMLRRANLPGVVTQTRRPGTQ